jgi:hypothetical protein
VYSEVSESFIVEILNALSRNHIIEELKFSNMKIGWYQHFSLQFLETNSTLKSLDLSYVQQFSEDNNMFLNDILMKNNSLTDLNLSYSDFFGPFEFLKKNNLKKFTFLGIWESLKPINPKKINLFGLELRFPDNRNVKDFVQCLKSNSSLIHLSLSKENSVEEKSKEFGGLIDVLSSHNTIECLSMKNFKKLKESKDFHKLLKNSKLKELKLEGSLETGNSFEKVLKALNKNENLTLLEVSGNEMDYIYFEKFKITNNTIQTINLAGLVKIF